MEQSSNSGQKISFSITMLVLALLAVVIPFSSKVSTKTTRKPPLVLRTESELALLKGDKDGNNTADWKDLVLETMSTSTRELAKQAPTDPKTLERINNPNNLTSSFSKNIYTASAFVSQNKDISEDDQANLVSGLIEKEARKIKPKVYTMDDVIITKGDTSKEKIQYGNEMALLLKEADSYKLGSDDMKPLAKFNQSKDEKDLVFFVNKKEGSEKILEKLLAMKVPPSAAILHLNLINQVSMFVLMMDAFSTTKEDPIKSLAFVNSYEETALGTIKAIGSIKSYFDLAAVPFAPNDPGYIFIKKK